MTSKTDGVDTYVYSWSEDNQLLGVSLNSSPVVSYEYDSGSRMLQRVEGSTSTNYHWDGWDLVREEKDDGVGVEITNYLVPQGEVLAFQRDGDWFYLHGDGLSSTQLVTDESGAQVGRAVYGAWGETLSSNESVPGVLDVRFVGGLGVRNDAATGLIWMRHRWYDPDTQRFISRDPIKHLGGINLYSYGANNPVNFVDPEGLTSLSGSFYTGLLEGVAVTAFTFVGAIALASTGPVGAGLALGALTALSFAGIGIAVADGISRIASGRGYSGNELARMAGQTIGGGTIGRIFGPASMSYINRFSEGLPGQTLTTPCPPSNPIQAALANSPLRASQPRLSEPIVHAYAQRLLNGEVPPPIKVAEGVIVSGHHRYAASRLTGIEIPRIEWYLSEGQRAKSIPMSEVIIDPVDWGFR